MKIEIKTLTEEKSDLNIVIGDLNVKVDIKEEYIDELLEKNEELLETIIGKFKIL